MNQKKIVFINYSRNDRSIVENQIYNELNKHGFAPWIDIHDIFPGEDWLLAIKNGIKNSNFFLCCLSRNSVAKRGIIQKEINIALDLWLEKRDDDIFLIPILLKECEIPAKLAKFQAVKLFENNGFEKLISALNEGLKRLSK